jgi:hypothetical protein
LTVIVATAVCPVESMTVTESDELLLPGIVMAAEV